MVTGRFFNFGEVTARARRDGVKWVCHSGYWYCPHCIRFAKHRTDVRHATDCERRANVIQYSL